MKGAKKKPPAASPSPWRKAVAPDGTPYYWNVQTSQTVWALPEGVTLEEEPAAASQAKAEVEGEVEEVLAAEQEKEASPAKKTAEPETKSEVEAKKEVKKKKNAKKAASSQSKAAPRKGRTPAEVRLEKRHVFRGLKERTRSGLKLDDLVRNKRGRIVSKKKSQLGKKSLWLIAVAQAYISLKVTGFVPVNGKEPPGKELYLLAKELHLKAKAAASAGSPKA